MFGTTDGQIIVMSSQGAMVTQVTVLEGMEITTLLWSCEKFNMEEEEGNQETDQSGPSQDSKCRLLVLVYTEFILV
jgi:hypothetical protein